MTTTTACKLLGLLLTSFFGGCSSSSDIMGIGDNAPFGGRTIQFNSTYVYFPSDFSMSIVRDTMPQADACRILSMYATTKPALHGLPVLPYTAEHYALVITVDSVMPCDDVSFDKTTSGGPGDMRYAGLGQYGPKSNQAPLWASRASGVVRIAQIEQYKHVGGKFSLQFDTGETIAEDFAIDACSP